MKLIVNTLEKLMPLHKTIFLYSDLNFSFSSVSGFVMQSCLIWEYFTIIFF